MGFELDGADKIERVLGIYTKLINGAVISKAEEAARYSVNERSIQRDIDDIRNYMDQKGCDDGIINTVIYDRAAKGFRLEEIYKLKFTNPEILAICKILLDSRAFKKDEMMAIVNKLVDTSVPVSDQKMIMELIRNEEFHYIEPRHGKTFIGDMWEMGQAIQENKYIEISYQGIQGSQPKKRKLKPVAIMFDEMYFYLAAFLEDKEVRENFSVIDDSFPTIYRVDRIQSLKVLNEKFNIPYKDRFEEGEFRKRIQFMFGGKLRKVKFKYSGYSVEAVLDKLPTAKILDEEDGVYTITAEVFGDGIDMWFSSQGDRVNVIK